MTESMQATTEVINMDELDFRFAISNISPRLGRIKATLFKKERRETIEGTFVDLLDEQEIQLMPCNETDNSTRTLFNDPYLQGLENNTYKREDFLCPLTQDIELQGNIYSDVF